MNEYEEENADTGPYFAFHTRMGPTVYWGPFATLREALAWGATQRFSTGYHRMLSPSMGEDEGCWDQGAL